MTNTKDIVQDIIKFVGSGFSEYIKISANQNETVIGTTEAAGNLFIRGTTHTPVKEFYGEFGLGNLGFLKGLLNLPNYKEDTAKLEVITREKNGEEFIDGFKFTDVNKNTDRYRVMTKEAADAVIKPVAKFKGATWEIEFSPTKAKVNELQSVAGLYNGVESNFTLYTENNSLVMTMGDEKGSFYCKRVLVDNVSSELKPQHNWILSHMMAILQLGMSGDCTVRISKLGIIEISIDTGIAVYNYWLKSLNM